MALTPADLANPIDWKLTKYQTMLQDLQANILKGHGRHRTRNIFLRVKTGQSASARAGVHKVAPFITSAETQLRDATRFKACGLAGGTVALLFFTNAGYAELGVATAKTPADASFRAGMPGHRTLLTDPATSAWDTPFKTAPHAMLLLADDCDAPLGVAEDKMLALLGAGWTKTGSEIGEAIFDHFGQGIEHFGYMDGRSQPLLLAQDVAAEPAPGVGGFKWNPAFGPGIAALVKDPSGGTPDSYGSYFIFRKLQQDVATFKAQEAALSAAQTVAWNAATTPKASVPDSELAGAQMVGRFENGFPVINGGVSPAVPPATPDNNFNYAADAPGDKCPLHGHVRKVNPRDGSERARIMPRRGIPFGGPEGTTTNPVGLLFMAYNNDIARQFEFTQATWANNANFPTGGTGVDPLIGQSVAARPPYAHCPITWGDPAHRQFAGKFKQAVTMKGGDYFFAPSLSGLANL